MICAKFGWNWPKGSGEEGCFSILQFLQFRNYLPLEKGGPFIWTNLNPLYSRMLCAKFGLNCPSGSGEEDENVKSLRKQRRWQRQWWRRTTDKFWSEKLTWALGSGELKWEKEMKRKSMFTCILDNSIRYSV